MGNRKSAILPRSPGEDMTAQLPAPLERSPSFGELSIDELHHRFSKGILSPDELVSDSIGNLLAVVPYGGLTKPDGPMENQPWKQSSRLGSGFWGTTFVRTAAPDMALGLVQQAEDLGAVCIGFSTEQPARNPLFPDQLLQGPWGGGASALLGWAVQFALGFDQRGNLARTVLATGLPGFRLPSPAPGMPAPGWLHNYLVDSPILAQCFLKPASPRETPRLRLEVSPEWKFRLGTILRSLPHELAERDSETGLIRILPLNDETILAAESLGCSAAYIPWRPGSSDATFFQILSPSGTEMTVASIVRLLAGPAAESG